MKNSRFTPPLTIRLVLARLIPACFFSFFTISGAPLSAQDLAGVSVCIDPGHGPGNTNAGPTGLREADINFQVALFLKDYLEAANADTVILTHMNTGAQLTLSQREQIANNAGVTWFHSVHHNATGQPVNNTARFTLLLLEEARSAASPCPNGSARGTGQPEWPGQSDVMSELMARHIYDGYRTASWRVDLDWTFYGSCNGGFSLGVLNDLQMPGQLSEATFHDHAGEEAKMRNPEFLRLEARALAMSFFDYFEAGDMATGALTGIVSDRETGAPFNGMTVTINPGGLDFVTDNFDNGVYTFDALVPGDYTVSVRAAGFDDVDVFAPVQAHAFSHADLRLISNVPPVVTTTSPSDSAQDVIVYEPLRFAFSRKMNTGSMGTAFVLDPPVSGTFRPDGDQSNYIFIPDFRLEFATTYTVTILASATDEFGHPLDGNGDGIGGDDFAWQFTTMSETVDQPVIVDFYPRNGQSQIFLREVVEVWFNHPLDLATVNDQTVEIKFGRATIAPIRIFADVVGGRQKLSLVPTEQYGSARSYTVTLRKEIQTETGVAMPEDFAWRFITLQNSDDWETVSEFLPGNLPFGDPQQHPESRNYLPDLTSWQDRDTLAISDPTTAQLRYAFNDAPEGELHLGLANPIVLQHTDMTGLFVYGDSSNNLVRWEFQGADSQFYAYERTVDWHGWRNLHFIVTADTVQGAAIARPAIEVAPLRWHTIVLLHKGEAQGELFFDDLIHVHPHVTAVDEPATASPTGYWLAPSYPNPFNVTASPATTQIGFAIAHAEAVRLTIADLTGRLVRTLIDDELQPGAHRALWDGRDDTGGLVAAGLYLVRMTSDRFTATGKLVLMR